MPKQSIEQQILLPTPPEKVWIILTDSHYTKQYMFNCEVKSSWEIGSPVIWEGNYQGYQAYQKGEVLNIQPGKLLKYSTFDPNYGMEDVPENYIHVTYVLKEQEGGTELTITNETFDGKSERITHISQGWDTVMAEILRIVKEENDNE